MKRVGEGKEEEGRHEKVESELRHQNGENVIVDLGTGAQTRSRVQKEGSKVAAVICSGCERQQLSR